MKKLFFYGDSNTWGFDPRDGGRYPENIRWTGRLAASLAGRAEIASDGLNGRCVPDLTSSFAAHEYVTKMLTDAGKIDLFAVMLGTNDLWWPMHPSASDTAMKMKALLRLVREKCSCPILLIAPPLIEELRRESEKLAREYRKLAAEEGYFFADAGQWHIALAFDRVHFSEEGHRQFAERMQQEIGRIEESSEKKEDLTGRLPEPHGSAVLVALTDTEEGPAFLMEVRSMKVRQPGEICFPGGGIEPGETAEETALRETKEELGIPREKIHVQGVLGKDALRGRGRVTPVLAKIDPLREEEPFFRISDLELAGEEVAEAFTLPVAWLKEHEPAVYDLDGAGMDFGEFPPKLQNYLSHYDTVRRGADTYYWEYKEYGIWGLTARILYHTIKELPL